MDRDLGTPLKSRKAPTYVPGWSMVQFSRLPLGAMPAGLPMKQSTKPGLGLEQWLHPKRTTKAACLKGAYR
jgi:hypothetical protein